MPYKDRSLGLIIFGVMTILLGCAAGLLGIFTLFSQSLVPQEQRVPIGSLVPVIGMYGVIGVGLIVLGIGSIMARRWARALLLIFSWAWLVLGVFEMVVMAVILPMVMSHMPTPAVAPGQSAPPTAAIMGFVMVFTFLFLGFFFVLLPGIWTFFYYSPHVKATCEARDPKPCWTDACPLPVLAISLWMWTTVPWMLIMPFTGMCVMPLFGMLLTGVPAGIVCFLVAAILAVCGWLLYRVDIRGWWIIMIFIILGSTSSIITFSFHDMIEIYHVMNYPQAQIDQVQKLGIFNGHAFVWLIGPRPTPLRRLPPLHPEILPPGNPAVGSTRGLKRIASFVGA